MSTLRMSQSCPVVAFRFLLLLVFCEAFCVFHQRDTSNIVLFEQKADTFSDDEVYDDNDGDYIDVDTSNFRAPQLISHSFNGRSSPSQRKAIGLPRSSNATIHICENCGTEYVQWVGRCSTCFQWNTLRSQSVPRRTADEISKESSRKPLFHVSEDENLEVELFFKGNDERVIDLEKSLDKHLPASNCVEIENAYAIEGRAMTVSEMKPVAIHAIVVAGNGLRSVEGIDLTRLCRVLAILQKKFGIDFRQYDVFVECEVQVERNADLALVAAVMSSLFSIPVRTDSLILGEIDLLGHIQPIDGKYDLSQFSRIVCGGITDQNAPNVDTIACRNISDGLDKVLVRSLSNHQTLKRH